MNSIAFFETVRASRYLSMLCHHFGKKVEAQCNAGMGWVQFPFGRCDMTADECRLTLHATAEDESTLEKVEHIVTSHLERFAFREKPELVWQTKAK